MKHLSFDYNSIAMKIFATNNKLQAYCTKTGLNSSRNVMIS